VRLEPCEAGLTIVATDKYRLHVAEVPLTSGEAPEVLVSPELLEAAARHGGDDTLALGAKGGMFGVSSDEFRLSGRQVDAEFPRWRPLMPTPGEDRAVIEVAELARVVDHVQVMAGPGDDDIVELRFAGDMVEASAFVTDRRARAEGTCTVHGAEMAVNLRPAYLRDALSALPSTHAAVHVEKSKCLLLPCSAAGEVVAGTSVLVMGRKRPVR
jgi:DNA polymerase-3 subunit beta